MLRRSHQGTVVAYKNVCSMFGENYEDVDPSELFGHFAQFIEAYKVYTGISYNINMFSYYSGGYIYILVINEKT